MALAGPAPPESVVISVRLKDDAGAVVKVRFSRVSTSTDIEKTILRGLGIKQQGVDFRLIDADDVNCTVDNSLDDGGTYSFELV